ITANRCGLRDFTGPRWRCMLYRNYDLCGTCRARGLTSYRHSPDHPMERIEQWLRVDAP
ncbi:unnamed protein product, partial [Phaeothamnion confervicola]